MATAYTEVFERFAMKVKDYELDALYTLSVSDYNTYIRGFLVNAIPKFAYDCITDISSTARDDTTMVFTNTLAELEIEILAQMMVVEYVGREVRKLEDMRRSLGDSDFKLTSGANSLRENKGLLVNTKEDLSSLIVQYTWENADFDEDL
jgi:hypothetical protein